MACWSTAIILTSFLLFCIPVQGTEANHSPELAEREAFIRKAMEEEDEKINKIPERIRRGALLIVTRIVPFGDWDFYYVQGSDLIWEPNRGSKIKFPRVIVPSGFVTDLASIPRTLWQVLRPEGRYAYAAVVHDYLYWMQTRPREEADQIFRLALEDSKVEPLTIKTLYQAVRLLGQAAWDRNARLKESGERRLLKEFPKDFTISWSDWKNQPDVFREDTRFGDKD